MTMSFESEEISVEFGITAVRNKTSILKKEVNIGALFSVYDSSTIAGVRSYSR